MSVSARELVELILLGPVHDRRQLQDSPILGDVWIAYAERPSDAVDCLLTPHRNRAAGKVASQLAVRIRKARGASGADARVAFLQGVVAAHLTFEEIVTVVVPTTQWWQDRQVQTAMKEYRREDKSRILEAVIHWTGTDDARERAGIAKEIAHASALDRYITLAAIILWGATRPRSRKSTGQNIADRLAGIKSPRTVFRALERIDDEILSPLRTAKAKGAPQVWQISLNRPAVPALSRSVPSVKGDAARTLFDVKCDKIAWAVLDSGIDGSHPAFQDSEGDSRVVAAYDFSHIRDIISLDNLNTRTPAFRERLAELRAGRERELPRKEATDILRKLAEDADQDRSIHWELVERFIRVPVTTEVAAAHGTHVAGIIGASRDPSNDDLDRLDGMCPDIRLYDFRVLGQTLEDTEFAIIAALQFIRYLNDRHDYITVHGANLSLSIKHDVRNYACGRTPICDECTRLVENGVVVVAAAGNLGYHQFETKAGTYEGYAAFSITDPGNADDVITVGATHRYRPHTYGVSFFSSRGPTGDGRMKPDLVAPGERIRSSLPDNEWGDLDGTSMAAPHVSGAAAMLMARYPELIGAPRKIKQILCESATDLGRERSFQGHGLLDVLRAFQKI